MDFRHHVKCTVHIVLGVVIIGIVYQHLPDPSNPPPEKKITPGREKTRTLGLYDRTAF